MNINQTLQISQPMYIPLIEKVNQNWIRNKIISPLSPRQNINVTVFSSSYNGTFVSHIWSAGQKRFNYLENTTLGLLWLRVALQFGLELFDMNIWPWPLKCWSMYIALRMWSSPLNSSHFKHVSKCLEGKTRTLLKGISVVRRKTQISYCDT